jgi:hypothetical protein
MSFFLLLLAAVGLLLLGAMVVACILLLVQHLRNLGQLRSSLNSTGASGCPKRILDPHEPMHEQQSLLESGHALFPPRRRPKHKKQNNGRWWLPANQRRRRKQKEDEEELTNLKHSGRASTDLNVLERGSEAFDPGLLAATFCRSSRVLQWHDRTAPRGFDRRFGKHSFLVSPVPHGRRQGDHVQGAVGRQKDVPKSSSSSSSSGNDPQKPALLLSLIQLPQDRTIKSIAHDSAPFHALADVAMSIRHPYLMKIIGFHAVSSYGRRSVGSQAVAIVRGITNVGSLRNVIFPYLHDLKAEAPNVGIPLQKLKLQLWSRQILEGMVALQRMSLTPIHIHSGNCMVVYDTELGEEIIQLTGFEYSLLGLDMSSTALSRKVKKAYGDGWSNIETLIFGHLFFEMCFGMELDDVVPDYTGTNPTRRFYDHPIRRVLDLIFEGGGFLHPDEFNDGKQDEENKEKEEKRNDTVEDGLESGDGQQMKQQQMKQQQQQQHQSVGEDSKSKTLAAARNGPTWQTRRSKKRLDLKHLCEHYFFQVKDDEDYDLGDIGPVVRKKGPTIQHSKVLTWEENEIRHDKILKLARLHHRRKFSRYVRRRKKTSTETEKETEKEENELLFWAKTEPPLQPTDRRRKSTANLSRERGPSTSIRGSVETIASNTTESTGYDHVNSTAQSSSSSSSSSKQRPQIAAVPTITKERGGLLAAIRGGKKLKKAVVQKEMKVDDSKSSSGAGSGNPLMAAIMARRSSMRS